MPEPALPPSRLSNSYPWLPWGAVALAVLVILVATLREAGTDLPQHWTLALVSGDAGVAELIQNLLLFMPLGAALAVCGVKRLPLVASGFALSLTVEFLQQWIPGRDPSVGDIVSNTISTLLGAGVVWSAPHWLSPSVTRAPWMALAATVIAAGAWLATGWLQAPVYPTGIYYDRWTPDIDAWDNYPGHLVAASLGPLPLVRSPIPGGPANLAAGQPLSLTVVAGRASSERSPLLIISDDPQRDIVIVGVAGRSLLVSYYTRAVAYRFERLDLRLRGALAAVAPADTFTVTTRPAAHGRYCINQACDLGYTMGDGWKLIFFPEGFSPGVLRAINVAWIAGGVLFVGFWGVRHPATFAALVLAVLALAFGPRLVNLRPTPFGEWLGAAAGIGVGWLCRQIRAIVLQRPA